MRPPMDLFKAIFADSDSSSSSDEADDRQSPTPAPSIPPITHEKPIMYIPSSSQEPLQASSEKHWKDLSVVASHVEPLKEAYDFHSKQHLESGTIERDSERLQLVSETSLPTNQQIESDSGPQPRVTCYGPSLPPGITIARLITVYTLFILLNPLSLFSSSDILQSDDHQEHVSSSASRRHSHSHDRERHKRSHKKHKKDVSQSLMLLLAQLNNVHY